MSDFQCSVSKEIWKHQLFPSLLLFMLNYNRIGSNVTPFFHLLFLHTLTIIITGLARLSQNKK